VATIAQLGQDGWQPVRPAGVALCSKAIGIP